MDEFKQVIGLRMESLKNNIKKNDPDTYKDVEEKLRDMYAAFNRYEEAEAVAKAAEQELGQRGVAAEQYALDSFAKAAEDAMEEFFSALQSAEQDGGGGERRKSRKRSNRKNTKRRKSNKSKSKKMKRKSRKR